MNNPIPINDLAHVVRAPLTVIKTELALAKAGADNSNLITSIEEQVDLLARIMDDVELITASHNSGLKAGTEKVNVAEIAKDIVATTNTKEVELSLNVKGDLELTFLEDHLRIILQRMITLSILDGATKLELEASELEISVRDNGMGTEYSQEEVDAKIPKYSRRSSIGLMTIKLLAELYGYRMSVSVGPAGSMIQLTKANP